MTRIKFSKAAMSAAYQVYQEYAPGNVAIL